MTSITDSIEAYLVWLDRQPLAPTTRRMYAGMVRQYATYLQAYPMTSGDPMANPVARDHAVRDFKTYLKTVQQLKPRSINLALAAIDHFYRSVHMDAAHVRREDLPHHAPQALSRDDQKRLIRTLEHWPSLRDRAVITLLLYTGLRAGECAALNGDDIQISARRGRVIVRNGKGQTYREVPLNADVRTSMTDWLHERQQRVATSTEAACFLTRNGRRFGVRAINLLLHRVGAAANLAFSAHTLRHTCLTNLVRQGTDLVVVAEIAGHRRLDTTRQYTLPTVADREAALEAILIHDA